MTCVGFVPALDPHAGGVFQYSATMMEALSEIARADAGLQLVALLGEDGVLPPALAAGGWRSAPREPPAGAIRQQLRRLVGEGPHRRAFRWIRRHLSQHQDVRSRRRDLDAFVRRDELARWWRQQGIERMIYPQPQALAFEVGLPYAVAIHDLQHRLQPEFAEVSADGEWEVREYILRNCCRHASQILVDSELGREHVLFFYGPYGVTERQVQVLPFLPSSMLPRDIPAARQQEIRRCLSIPERYVFYPAQFWPHKNHLRIVEALEQLKRMHQLCVPAVFCGSHTGAQRDRHFQLLMDMARQCGVADQIHVLGYVPDDELAALYTGAVALVMPTFFGPTNIPVIEAWALRCPVLTSDLPGTREQAGDAAVLVDPRMVDALTLGIRRLWTDEALRQDLMARGQQRLATYTMADYRQRLGAALQALTTGG
jgi:glycosyltransferase involved in cell wall biosynthesis